MYTVDELKSMSTDEMIDTFSITINGDGIRFRNLGLKPEHVEVFRARKSEIIDRINAREEERADRQRRIDAIPGLDELKDAMWTVSSHRAKVARIMEEGTSIFPATPDVDLNAIRAKYPRAAAYIIAREWTLAANDKKAELGKIAQNKIIYSDSNEEAVAAIDEMKKAFSAYCEAHMWD